MRRPRPAQPACQLQSVSPLSTTSPPPLVEWPEHRSSVCRAPTARAGPAPSATAVRRRPEPRTNILDRGASSHTKRNTFGRSLCRVISLEYVVAQRAHRTLSQLRLCRIPEPARRGGCLLRHVRDSLQSLSTPLMARLGTGGALKGRA